MKRTLSLFLLLFSGPAFAQKKAPAPLKVVNSLSVYKNACRQNPDKQLVDLKKAIPNLQLDIRYATKNNFMKQVMYPQARAFARKPVALQLQKIQSELHKKGLGLRIYDAYRPYSITVAFYQKASDKHFVANPAKGSKHNRGCAIDLSLINLKTGKELPMPTPYDSFAPEAAADYAQLPPSVINNRNLLIRTMQAHGFRVLKNEWWHYDFVGWQNYELLDIPFKDL